MMMYRLTLCLFLLAAPAFAQTLEDDFAAGADPMRWEPDSVGFVLRDGAYFARTGTSVWRAAPFASEATFSCDVTVEEVPDPPVGWGVAGIGLGRDDGNYWGLSLIQAPEAQGGGRHLELHENLDGVWLAQTMEGSRLETTGISGTDFHWETGTTYRLELTNNAQGIVGRVLDGETEAGRFAYAWQGPTKAVRTGRPIVRARGLGVRFDNARVEVRRTAEEPKSVRETHPWVSRQAPKIADATGFFSTAKTDGRWWMVDPEGRAFFGIGTDHSRYEGHWCEKLDYSPYGRNMAKKFPDQEDWARSTTDRLKAWGFNTVAAGHSPSTRHKGLAHVLFASFGSAFAPYDWICEPIHWTGFPNVFSPDWPTHCELTARRIAKESLGDPWVIGTFLDNELEWYGKKGSLVDEVFQRGADHTAKRALLDWLLERYGDMAGINAALQADHADPQAFLADTRPPRPTPELAKIRDDFLQVIAQRYFSVAYEAMRRADPDHMVMGARFAGNAPKSILPIAGRYTDVFTINTYPRVDMVNGVVLETPAMLAEVYALAQKPMIITEWSFPALDSGLPCKHGAGMRVDTQAQKARCYEVFARMIADLPFMVGYHYFMWVDEPALGISSTFPEDSNYGLVNEKDEPYAELVETARRVNRAAAQRHTQTGRMDELPAILERMGPKTAGEPRLAIGEKTIDDAHWSNLEPVDEARLEGAGAAWTIRRGEGALFARVEAEGLRLGRIEFAAHTLLDGQPAWTPTDRIESLRTLELPEATLLEAVVSRGADRTDPPTPSEPPRYRALVRAAVFRAQPIVLIRPQWIESLDPRPFTLENAFIFPRPSIGGSVKNDAVGGRDVPNYYLGPAGFWTDEKLGGALGAASAPGQWAVTFWQGDDGQHPDARIKIEKDLTKGERWTSKKTPYLWLFALKDAEAWRKIALQCVEVAQRNAEER